MNKSVDEFGKVVKVFAKQNGSKLKRVKNENSKVTLTSTALDCTWGIHSSPKRNMKHFRIKTFRPEHICARTNENCKANST